MPPKRQPTEFENELTQKLAEKDLPNGKKYTASSIKVFTANIYKLHKMIYPEGTITNMNWLMNYQEVIKALNKAQGKKGDPLTLNAKISYYNAVIVSLSTTALSQEIKQHYADVRDALQVQRDQEQPKGKNPSKQQDIIDRVSKQDIFTMIDKLIELSNKKDDSRDAPLKRRNYYMKALIFKIHTLHPLRNDIANMKIITKEFFDEMKTKPEFNDTNWIVIQSKNISMIKMKYKTATKYGMTVIKINDDDLKSMIRTWITDWLKIEPMDMLYNKTPLISYNTGTPYTSNDLSHIMLDTSEKFLGKDNGLSTTIMAKIFSLAPVDIETATIEELAPAKEQAKQRGHSLKTKLSSYSK
jgi:hypothetical protein